MDVVAARAELERVGLTYDVVAPVEEQGWASWTFELDRRFIVRFPRNDDIVAAMQREMRVLPELARHVSFRVPEPLHTTETWFVYEKIPGRGFERGDDVDTALAMIAELHTFPLERANALLQRPSREESFAETRRMFETEVFPHLDADLIERAQVLLEPPAIDDEHFIHDDLGAEHVIVDDGKPVGIIDFEDATIGDPECDRMPLYVLDGRLLSERMWRYHCRGTLHAIVHAVWENEIDEIPAAIAELRRRLDLRPGR